MYYKVHFQAAYDFAYIGLVNELTIRADSPEEAIGRFILWAQPCINTTYVVVGVSDEKMTQLAARVR